ncbi:MAG: hypothetical protein KH841_05320, partial [Collinsella sp.]|nr:hypothetical protein [Collinsella sp.]
DAVRDEGQDAGARRGDGELAGRSACQSWSNRAFLIAVFSVVVCHSFSNRLMFVLFVDVLVVVSDVLAVGDVLTLGCYAVFNEPVRQLLQGRDGTAHARRKASCSKSRQQCPGCLTCGSYLIKLSLRLGLYFADLPSLTR